jgi:hypothetical protein
MEVVHQRTRSEAQSPTESAHPRPRVVLDERKAADRIPDSLAVLSYGTQVLARPPGGPRVF